MTGILSAAERRAALEEAARRLGVAAPQADAMSARDAERQHAFMRELHPRQLAFVQHPSKRKAAKCGRRAGKTTLLVFLANQVAKAYPNATIPYVCLDRETGKRLFWRPLKELNAKYRLGLEFNQTSLTATLPNGAMIWVCGAKDEDDIEKFRGDKYPLVMVDESGSFKPHLQELVETIVEPALEDYDGTLVMVGTPGKIAAGMFYEATTGALPGWHVDHWTILDNPKFPRWVNNPNWKAEAAAWLENLRKSKGWAEDHPTYVREWLGEWVEDDSSTVYRFDPVRNAGTGELPVDREWHYILGIDFGFSPDPTAITISAFSPHDPNFHVVETFTQTEMMDSDIAAKVRFYERKYGDFVAKVGDPAAKQFFMNLNQRFGLGIQPAEKAGKNDWIENMNSDFRLGRIKVHCRETQNEYKRLVWNADHTKEHPGRPNHRCDAILYSYRKSRHYVGHVQEAAPAKDSPEYHQAAIDQYIEQLEEKARKDRDNGVTNEYELDYNY